MMSKDTITIQRRVVVSGKVQGVGFRMSLLTEAEKHLGVRGYVKNLPDGRVEAVFAGGAKEVLHLSAWCKEGPSRARVTHLEVYEEEVNPNLRRFCIQ